MIAKGNGHASEPLMPASVPDEDGLELLDANQLADLFKVKPSWVRSATRARSANQLPHIKVGRYTRFQERAVRQWLDSQKRAYPGHRR